MKHNLKLTGRLRNYLILPIFLTILLVILNIPIYFVNQEAGVMVSGFLVVYVVCMFASFLRNQPVLVKEVINFATQYSTVQKKLLNEFEIPYALLDINGKILWMNNKFGEVTGKDKGYHKTIFSIFHSISKEELQKGEGESNFYIHWEDKVFRAETTRLYFESMVEQSSIIEVTEKKEDSAYLIAFYLFDETELSQYIQENREQKLVSALLYIDNYDEALDSIEDVKRSLLIALIDRKINKYFNEMDALVRKIEKDKYFIVFKYKYMEFLEEDKFSILEDVKTVKVGNEMSVTLSIGVGMNGDSYKNNYEFSRMAIDLALGRGGDQAVVKEYDRISYYGGKSQTVEKSTRVKARVKAHALRETLESRENVIIMGHSISDADAFGAAVGIYCAARVLGKKAQIVLNTVTSSLRPIKECFTPDKGYPEDMFINSERALEIVNKNTLVMVVDTNRPNYTECPQLLNKGLAVVVFDHHRQSSEVIQNPVLS